MTPLNQLIVFDTKPRKTVATHRETNKRIGERSFIYCHLTTVNTHQSTPTCLEETHLVNGTIKCAHL